MIIEATRMRRGVARCSPTFQGREGAPVSSEEPELRVLVAEKTPFLELLDHLKARAGGDLGGFQLVAMLQQEAGISFVESREMLAYFEADWTPNAEPAVIDERWNAIVEGQPAHG
jgi:hypothetical protein